MSNNHHSASDFKHRTSTVVRFGDLDVMGHMNNVQLFRLLEGSRIDYLVDLELVRHDELSFTLASVQCDFRMPAKYGDELTCGTMTAGMGRTSLTVAHRVWRGEDELIAHGHSVIVSLGPDKSPSPIPDHWVEIIEEWEGRAIERVRQSG